MLARRTFLVSVKPGHLTPLPNLYEFYISRCISRIPAGSEVFIKAIE